MLTPLLLMAIGGYGIIKNKNHVILILVSIEVLLLGTIYFVLVSTVKIDDTTTILLSIIILVLAAVESAVGLSILVSHYRESKSVSLRDENL